MQIHCGWVFGHIGTALTAISGEDPLGKVRNAGRWGGSGAAHIWLSASRDEWLGDNRASAAGRKMIPRPAVAADYTGKASSPLPPPTPTCYQHLWESGRVTPKIGDRVFIGDHHWVWSVWGIISRSQVFHYLVTFIYFTPQASDALQVFITTLIYNTCPREAISS